MVELGVGQGTHNNMEQSSGAGKESKIQIYNQIHLHRVFVPIQSSIEAMLADLTEDGELDLICQA